MCKEAVKQIRTKDLDYYNELNVYEAARLVISEYKNEIPVPIVQIVRDAGFKVFLQDLLENINGCIAISGDLVDKFDTDKIIIINNKNDASKRRATLAHEFGHYLLDPAARNVVSFYNAFEKTNDDSALETLINRFARELLMPDDVFKNKYNEYNAANSDYFELIRKLNQYFQVPDMSIDHRIQELQLRVPE